MILRASPALSGAATRVAAAVGAAIVVACSNPPRDEPSRTGVFGAGDSARRLGVASYRVTEAGDHRLRLTFDGSSEGTIQMDAVDGAVVEQLRGVVELDIRATYSELTLTTTGGRPLFVAAKDPACLTGWYECGWSVLAPLDDSIRAELTRLLAIDVDLAVAGSSLVFDGRAYVSCTTACESATSCAISRTFDAARADGRTSRCIASLASCVGCLEVEP